MTTRITTNVEIRTPKVVNYLRYAEADGTIDIADVSDESLRAVGDAWTAELIALAQTRRAKRKEGA